MARELKTRTAGGGTGRQAEKSDRTRRATLDAAIECFVEIGYAGSSTKIIAERAGITRGAMLHHFPIKRDLMNAVVAYINEKRIESFARAIRRLRGIEDRNTRGIDVYWRSLHTDLYVAYAELRTAARTDAELNEVLSAATAEFEQRWLALIREIYPEWAELGELAEFAVDLVQFAMEGMALNRLSHDVRRRQRRIRDFLNAIDADILAAAERDEKPSAVSRFLAEMRQKHDQKTS